MNNTLVTKVVIIGLVICGALFILFPNVTWYRMPLEERHKQAKLKNPLAEKVIPLGLDLQGGVRLVYQIDTAALSDMSDATVTRAIDQNIVVIKNRIDAFGVANPLVVRQGREYVVVEMPGVYESSEARNLIGKTALLEFRLVKDDEALSKVSSELAKQGVKFEDVVNGNIPDEIKQMIPEHEALMPLKDGGYLLVEDKPLLTGKYLKQARVEVGNTSQIGGLSIGFELDPEGATLFEQVTAAHLNERLAIILDNVIQSAPRIESRIPGGRGQITGSFSPQEAKNLAGILNSGNLQAPMRIVEERTVGPQLGEDSIRGGLKAIAVGFTLVILFMIVYYKFSGFLADIALVLNLIMLLAVMSYISAPLTMPGIAGVLLSLAMAVDANVIILERVREELRKGKDVKIAISEGYSRAFTAIFDGHVTAIVAALFLFQFGTGPVKGFGVTLAVGLLISLATAVWVTHVFYDAWFAVAKPQKLSV